jgi:hypothetical protein
VEAKIKEVMAVLGEDKLRLADPNMLVNVQEPGQKPVTKQGWHTDMAEGKWGIVAIGAVQPMTLLMFPGSRFEIQEFLRLEQLVADLKIKMVDMDAWLKSRSFKAVRLVLKPGDLLFLTGDTIHAGDRGINGQPSLRLHWYITKDGTVDNSTTHLTNYDDDFNQCFH